MGLMLAIQLLGLGPALVQSRSLGQGWQLWPGNRGMGALAKAFGHVPKTRVAHGRGQVQGSRVLRSWTARLRRKPNSAAYNFPEARAADVVGFKSRRETTSQRGPERGLELAEPGQSKKFRN